MNVMLIVTFLSVAALIALLVAALSPRQKRTSSDALPDLGESPSRQHATYFGVIRQAMSEEDFNFLASRAPLRLVRRAHKERKHIAVLYLAELRADFERLLRLARVVAVLSPEIAASHEFERLRLSIRFSWRYRMVLLGLHAGLLFMPQLSSLNNMVSQLSFRMNAAMKELGQRAVVAAELAATLNSRGLNLG